MFTYRYGPVEMTGNEISTYLYSRDMVLPFHS